MSNDYSSWYVQNKGLFEELFKNDSIIYTQLNDVIKVLNHIATLNKNDIDEELEVFKDTGFAYLFTKVEEVKYYLKYYFNDNMTKFLVYEPLINYALYLDDLKDTLQENEMYNHEAKKSFDDIHHEIETIIKEKHDYSNDYLDKYNTVVLSVVPSDFELLTIPEIFGRIVEEMQL